MILLNPNRHSRDYPDARSAEIMKKTIQFFESRGKKRLKHDDHERIWYQDFIDFVKKEGIFATLMTPPEYAPGATGSERTSKRKSDRSESENGAKPGAESSYRWDTWRFCEFAEILGFYGLNYWYVWQVSMLGISPVWMSDNEKLKQHAAQLLQDGEIFGFGLSEKEHGADLYGSEMTLYPQGGAQTGNSNYKAKGRKYYIGNGNQAALISTFGKIANKDEYVMFAVDSRHKNYECIQNVVNSQNFVAEYALHDYPITAEDILSRGSAAWDSALNTVNICKYNLGWASIGICTHALYEAINHAANRNLFGKYVTDFPHVRQLFVDAYSRLSAMKLFALRAADYMRSGSPDDRRYLLFNPVVKMKVTTQGEDVINHLWDVLAAKGFEKNMYFETAARDIRALPKLEGTVHVNMALIIKFMKNYFFKPAKFKKIPKRNDASHDEFLFRQGPTKGLGKIRFHDYRLAYNSISLPNIEIFKKQIKVLKALLMVGRPDKEQVQDFDFLLILGELFTLVVYGQLIIENAAIYKIDHQLLDQIFDFMVRDFSKFALQLYSKTSSTRVQRFLCTQMIQKPAVNPKRFDTVWKDHIFSLRGEYAMREEPRSEKGAPASISTASA